MPIGSAKNANKHHKIIDWLIVISLLFIRIIVVGVAGTISVFSGANRTPEALVAFYDISTYFLLAVFIWRERNHLEEFHIDGISLLMIIILKPAGPFIFFSLGINAPYAFPNPISWLSVIMPIVLSIALIIGKYKIPKIRPINLFWIIVGLASGLIVAIPSGLLFSFILKPNEIPINPYTFSDLFSSLLPLPFLSQVTFAGILEEPLFRGILWGYLRKEGISNIKILFIQAFLFMTAHIYYIKSERESLFIVIPFVAICLGLLAWRSRSVATTIAAHSTFNAITNQISWLFASLRN